MTQTPNKLTDAPDGHPAATDLTDLMSELLATVHLSGALFFRSEYTAPWALESPPSDELTHTLLADGEKLILFHVVAEGECWLRLQTGEQLRASAGDVVVMPYGHQHIMGSALSVRPVDIATLLAPLPRERFPTLRYGGGGTRTSVICGYLHCDNPLFEPVIAALPPLFSVRPPAGPVATWVAASVQYALDASQGKRPFSPGMAVRLPELLLSEVLRLYLESAPPQRTGWSAALRDPIVGPALIALHAEPEHGWTVEELARRVASSRTTLTEHFRRLLGRAPMQYLGEWRLQLASSLLRSTNLTVLAIAYRIGYESEAAFNRAFKRAMGSPPAQWRQHAGSA